MIHVDLTSGIGGFALAARRMGWRTVSFCEIDKFCQKVLRKNFPGVPVFSDLFQFNYGAVKSFYRKRGITIDRRSEPLIITAGLPCQPYSQAGQQKGRNDERFLFPRFFEIVRDFRPDWIEIENVRRLLTIHDGELFEEIAAYLESEGYAVQTFCIPACSVGAPHERYRVWLIAHADNQRQFGRSQQNQTGKRQIFTRCGNYRAFGEPAIRDSRIAGFTSNTAGDGLQTGRSVEQTGRNVVERDDFQSLADSFGKRLEGGEFGRAFEPESGSSRPTAESFKNEHWLEAAIRLCTLDDGLPDELDVRERATIYQAVKYFGRKEAEQKLGIDLGKVEQYLDRQNSIKSAGNAVVPELVYQTFKAIEYAENNYWILWRESPKQN